MTLSPISYSPLRSHPSCVDPDSEGKEFEKIETITASQRWAFAEGRSSTNQLFPGKRTFKDQSEEVYSLVGNWLIPEEWDTRPLRMLGSLPVGDKSIIIANLLFILSEEEQEEVVDLLFACREEEDSLLLEFLARPLRDIPEKKWKAVLAYYGMADRVEELQPLRQSGTIRSLRTFLAAEKREGLSWTLGWGSMVKLFRGFVQENWGRWDAETLEIVNRLHHEMERSLDETCELRVPLRYLEVFKGMETGVVDPAYQKLADEAVSRWLNQEIERIDGQVEPQIGRILTAGFPGHFIAMEIRRLRSGYEVVIGNAGAGVSDFHGRIRSEDLVGKPQFRTVRAFHLQNRQEVREVLKRTLMFSLPILGNGEVSGLFTKGFYEIFSGYQAVDLSHVPYRVIQQIGNCGVRSIEEIIFYQLQRCNRVDLANELQDYLIGEVAAAAPYPAYTEAAREMVIGHQIADPFFKPVIEPFFEV